jgi:hypothetical protein
MAMTLPGALLLVELVYFPLRSRSWRGPLAAAILVVPTIAVKVLTRNPLSADPNYTGHSLHSALEALRSYQSFLLYGDLFGGRLSTRGLLALWLAMGLAALLLRSRPMIFGLFFLIGSLLPVCLIARRGGYMVYLPLMGWALYTATLFHRLRDGLLRMAHLRSRAAAAIRLATFAAVVVLIVHVHTARLAPYEPSFAANRTTCAA